MQPPRIAPMSATFLRSILLPLVGYLLTAPGFAAPSTQRHFLFRVEAPYDIAKLNFCGGNYMQSLLQSQYDLIAFAHDAQRLIYTDDNGKMILAFVEEARYTPVVRLELVKRLMKGVIAAQIPGTRYKYFFVRDARKALRLSPLPNNQIQLIFGQDRECSVVDFTVFFQSPDGSWHSATELQGPRGSDSARRSKGDADSQSFQIGEKAHNPVLISGEFYNPYLDKAPRVQCSSPQAKKLRVELDNFSHPTRRERPIFNTVIQGEQYLILLDDKRKQTNARPAHLQLRGNFADALLVVWKGAPTTIMIEQTDGAVRKVQLTAEITEGDRTESVWTIPFTEIDPEDMNYIHSAATSIIATGQMGFNGFVPTRSCTDFAAPAMGLAAGAYLLKEYNDPNAPQALEIARGTLDAYIDEDKRGLFPQRISNLVRAAYYLIKAGCPEYTPWLEKWTDRILARRPSGALTVRFLYPALNDTIALQYAAEINSAKYAKEYGAMRTAFAVSDKPNVFYFNKEKATSTSEAYALFLSLLGSEGSPELGKYIQGMDAIISDVGLTAPESYYWTDSVNHYVGHCMKAQGMQAQEKRLYTLDEFVDYEPGKLSATNVPVLYTTNYPGKVDVEKYWSQFPARAFTSIQFRIQLLKAWGSREEGARDISMASLVDHAARLSGSISKPLTTTTATQISEGLESLLVTTEDAAGKMKEAASAGFIRPENVRTPAEMLKGIADDIYCINAHVVERYGVKRDMGSFMKKYARIVEIAKELGHGVPRQRHN